jgi:hypothetical protein
LTGRCWSRRSRERKPACRPIDAGYLDEPRPHAARTGPDISPLSIRPPIAPALLPGKGVIYYRKQSWSPAVAAVAALGGSACAGHLAVVRRRRPRILAFIVSGTAAGGVGARSVRRAGHGPVVIGAVEVLAGPMRHSLAASPWCGRRPPRVLGLRVLGTAAGGGDAPSSRSPARRGRPHAGGLGHASGASLGLLRSQWALGNGRSTPVNWTHFVSVGLLPNYIVDITSVPTLIEQIQLVILDGSCGRF